jgi:hypothetical protein
MPGVTVQAPTRLDALALIPTLRSLGCEVRAGRNPLAQDGRSVLVATDEQETLVEALAVVERWFPLSRVRTAN